MIYKVLIIKNRYTKAIDFKDGIEWFSKNTPLTIQTEEIETDFDLSFTKYGNDTYAGVGLDDESKNKFRSIVPRNKYHAVAVIYGNRAKGIRVSATNYNPLWPETEFVQLAKNDGKTFNHELIHTFFYRLKRKGIYIDDPMDKVVVNGETKHYYNNNSLTAKESNRTIAIDRLKPYWGKVAEIGMIANIVNAIIPPTIKPTIQKYKYFKDSEVVGLDPKLVTLLDSMREKAGVPFVITSGYRTPEHNKKIGGTPNSAHIRGLAVDLACTDNKRRTAMLRGILAHSGDIFLEVARKHLHIDIDSSIHSLGDTIIEPNDD